MEAYLWACYLWAYQQTGFELFYQRAENALRMTMAQYTDGWRWTNGLAQEKARILLPLAWLVRVKDTPEHRQWLRKAVDGLVALQEPCGAIREELGLPGRGMFPPPASNEAYGTSEAPLIQQNGDPVCDLLYTTNFAFLGLHEAAAAGDPQAAEAEEKLADVPLPHPGPQRDAARARRRLVPRLRLPPLGALGQQRRRRLGRLGHRERLDPRLDHHRAGHAADEHLALGPDAESKIARHFDRLRARCCPTRRSPPCSRQVRHAAVGKPVRLAGAPTRIIRARRRLLPMASRPADHAGPSGSASRGTTWTRPSTWRPRRSVAWPRVSSNPIASASSCPTRRVLRLRRRQDVPPHRQSRTRRPARDMTPQTVRLTVTAQKTSARYVRFPPRTRPLAHLVIAGSVPAWLFADEFLVNPE